VVIVGVSYVLCSCTLCFPNLCEDCHRKLRRGFLCWHLCTSDFLATGTDFKRHLPLVWQNSRCGEGRRAQPGSYCKRCSSSLGSSLTTLSH
jgi:hypothetical protein